MDLMTSSTSFADVKKKYGDFTAPTIRIEVDGTEITEKLGAGISAVTVDLTAGFAASGCSFDVMGEYDRPNSKFDAKGVMDKLQLGAKIEVLLGYIKTESVFYGLVAEVEYVFDMEDAPYIHVECVDAKCLLMKTQRLDIALDQKVSQSVTDILSAQPASAYLKGKEIDNLSKQEDMLPTSMESDYQFVVRQARYYGCEFFIVQGKAYFRKAPASASAIMTLAPRKGIRTARLSLRGGSLIKKAKVVGINPENDEAISGEATIQGNFSKGSTADRMMGESTKTFFEHDVVTAGEAKERATAIVKQAQSGFGRLLCSCVGLPELVPGRSVKITGLMPEADVTCYILEVRHTLDHRGFETTFEARVDKL
ncbi:hypothetical protein LJC63_00710 [Ruminococcaceae bacterium OttesenSCG-928-L11]|nr:hypothetical protein [Ruminococcaceae bacterium OttesenSCG-928-L11]